VRIISDLYVNTPGESLVFFIVKHVFPVSHVSYPVELVVEEYLSFYKKRDGLLRYQIQI